jgi:hypothetical protein
MGLGSAIGAPGIFAADTFTGAVDTPLPAHVPDSGGTWTVHPGYAGSAVLSDLNRVRSNASAPSLFLHSAAPGSPDYDVSADVVPVGSYTTQIAGVAGRVDPVVNTFYGARYNCSIDRWELYRVLAGSYMLLGTSAWPVLSQSRRLSLRLVGGELKALVDGTAVIVASDAAIGAAGKAGVWFLGSATNASGAHLDNWQASGGAGLACYAPATAGGTGQGGVGYSGWAFKALAAAGMATGGQASAQRKLSALAVGGMSLSGRGSLSWATSATGSGGLAHSGGKALSVLYAAATSGGLAFGSWGQIVRQVHVDHNSGGVATGGSGDSCSSLATLLGGGVSIGGQARSPENHTVTAAGGVFLGGIPALDYTVYYVYMNTGLGGPIDYTTPVATVAGSQWISGVLAAPGDYKFGVRARDARSGLEERNLDAMVSLVLDAAGHDLTEVPLPPAGLRAIPILNGKIQLEWSCPCSDPRRQPDGFRVYLGPEPAIDYSRPIAIVATSSSASGAFSTTVGDLVNGVSYLIGVRAFNSIGEENNLRSIVIVADQTPPGLVDGLEAVATNQES